MDGADVIVVPELERFFAPDVTCVLVTVLVVTIIKLLGAYNQRQLEYRTPVVVQARVDLAALKPIVAAINPKREFVRWAKTSRVQSSIRKELATLTKEDNARVRSAKSMKRYISILQVVAHLVLVISYRSTVVMKFPNAWLWPFSYIFAFPRHSLGDLGFIAFQAMTHLCIGGLVTAIAGCFPYAPERGVAPSQRVAAALMQRPGAASPGGGGASVNSMHKAE